MFTVLAQSEVRSVKVWLIRILKSLITKLSLTDDDVGLLQLLDLSLQPLQTSLDYWIEVSSLVLLNRLVKHLQADRETLPCTPGTGCHRM